MDGNRGTGGWGGALALKKAEKEKERRARSKKAGERDSVGAVGETKNERPFNGGLLSALFFYSRNCRVGNPRIGIYI